MEKEERGGAHMYGLSTREGPKSALLDRALKSADSEGTSSPLSPGKRLLSTCTSQSIKRHPHLRSVLNCFMGHYMPQKVAERCHS